MISQTAVLSRRALNRATLERQLLLSRSDRSVVEAVEHLVGLQAQTPHTWYVGLWSRLAGFRPERAGDLLTDRRLVRIALMRGTIHLVSAEDCLALRPLVQSALERSLLTSMHGRSVKSVDRAELVTVGRALLEEQPRTLAELAALLEERWPERGADSLAYGVRNLSPLVQLPPRGVWGRSGRTRHTTAEHWLGRPLDPAPDLQRMVLRYLAAFGPASVMDIQTWSGLTRLAEVVDRLRAQLVVLRDHQGRELFDLPDAPRPDPDVPSPPRFLYDFDNLLLSHADRSRVMSDAHGAQSAPKNGLLPGCVLVDGFTAGTWKITRGRGAAVLAVTPFAPLSRQDAEALCEEGERLLAFAAPEAAEREVRHLG